MRTLVYILTFWAIVMAAQPVESAIITKSIGYEHEGTALEGYLAYDDAIHGKRPALLVVHEWWGLNQYARSRAEQLAALGYVAMAVDMYGKGKVTEHPQKAGEWSTQVSRNVSFWRGRALAGLDILKRQPQTDPERIVAIGYCFGGSTVQQLAYGDSGLKGIVSFHGGLQEPPQGIDRKATAKILICHGGADIFVKPEKFQAYLEAMAQSGLDYQVIIYSGAKHGFTNPEAGRYKMPPLAYNASADRRSWEHMKLFLAEVFE